jgi:hypothetical protein
MHRLRHPVRAIREPFGTAGLVIACIAIVLALTGAAFAAGKLTSKQKKEVEKIAKKYAGKPGAPGASGPAGPAGGNGKDGANGTNGANGTDGISPAGTAFAGNANGCQEGGVKFVGANTTVACNGTKGTNGTNGKNVEVGSPTVGECANGGATVQVQGEAATKKAVCNGQTGFTETLPAGKTETGVYGVNGFYESGTEILTGASFSIPLADGLDSSHVHSVSNGEEFNFATESFAPATICLGNVESPTAPSGHFCAYLGPHSGLLIPAVIIRSPGGILFAAGKTGATLSSLKAGEGLAALQGSWAVTG